jgi:hypothetical protein
MDEKQESGARKEVSIAILFEWLSFSRHRESVVPSRINVKNGIVFPVTP